MKDLILHIFDFLSARKRLAAAIVVAVTVVCTFIAIFRVEYQENITAFFPKDEITEKYEEIYDKTGGNDKVVILFSPKGGDAAEAKEVFSSFHPVNDDADPMEVFSFLMDNAPYFLKEEDLVRMDSLLNQDGFIARKMQQNKQSLYSPATEYSTLYMRSDPLGMYEPMLQRLRALNPADGSDIEIAFVTSPYGGSESGMNAKLSKELQAAKDSTLKVCPDVEILITGAPVVAAGNASRMKQDCAKAFIIAALLIGLLLFLSFRRFADVLWIGITIIVSSAVAVGLVGAFRPEISLIVLGIGTMVIGIAVNYPLHYADHLKHENDRRKALKEMTEPLLVGNITTVGAFLSLVLLKADAIKDFGLIGSVLLVSTIIFVLLFLPVFLPDAGPRRTIRLDFDRNFNPGRGFRKVALVLFVIVSAFMGLESTKISFDTNLNNINYETPEQKKGFEILEAMGTGADSCETVYIAKESRVADEVLGGIDFLPSKAEQQTRLSDWRNFWENHIGDIRKMKDEAARAGFKPDAFEPFTSKIGKELAVKDIDFFSPLTSTIAQASFVFKDGVYTSIRTMMVGDGELDAVKDRIRAEQPEGTFVFSSSDLGLSLKKLMNEDFNNIGWICSMIVFFFLWLSFGRIELSLVSFLPLAIGWVWILGLMHLTGQQFNIVNIILATFIFGQGDDYTIFITEGLMYEYATGRKILSSYKNSIVLSALIMFVGIGALIVAEHPAMRSLAEVTMTGMVTVVIMAYCIPPAIFRYFTRRKGELRTRPLMFRDILRTFYAMTVFLIAMIVLAPCTLFIRNKDRFHILLHRIARIAVNGIPGVKFTAKITEDISTPALCICNHQSHLDVLAVMAINPKLVILTNNWAWNNIFYGRLIRHAEFFQADGIENHIDDLRDLVRRGYSILVYPEGTRSEDCSILRFHRGAFVLAKELGLEILPLYIHGFGYVMPKKEHIMHSAGMYLETGRRETVGDGSLSEITKEWRRRYIDRYEEIRTEMETPEYNREIVRARYLYKGREAEKAAKKELSKKNLRAALVRPADGRLVIEDAGYGAFALLYALSNKDIEVDAYINDEEKYLVATNCAGLPDNLHYHLRS
ncbi:MAG: MMPL family transporter [Bacteroidales bacterium]|nr:MMPL family transporter [Bacteroidales bacterium]